MDNDDKIAQHLNLTPKTELKDDDKPVVIYKEREKKDTTLETVQDGLNNIIEVGEQAMERLAIIADSSELSVDFEALTKMMRELREANKDLLEIEKTLLEIEKRKNSGDSPESHFSGTPTKVIHNTIFTGSSKEALEEINKLKGMKNEN